jgi:hypothetical protein
MRHASMQGMRRRRPRAVTRRLHEMFRARRGLQGGLVEAKMSCRDTLSRVPRRCESAWRALHWRSLRWHVNCLIHDSRSKCECKLLTSRSRRQEAMSLPGQLEAGRILAVLASFRVWDWTANQAQPSAYRMEWISLGFDPAEGGLSNDHRNVDQTFHDVREGYLFLRTQSLARAGCPKTLPTAARSKGHRHGPLSQTQAFPGSVGAVRAPDPQGRHGQRSHQPRASWTDRTPSPEARSPAGRGDRPRGMRDRIHGSRVPGPKSFACGAGRRGSGLSLGGASCGDGPVAAELPAPGTTPAVQSNIQKVEA